MNQSMRPREDKKRRVNQIIDQNQESRRFDALTSAIRRRKIEKQFLDAPEDTGFGKMDAELELLRRIDYHSFLGYFIAYALFNCCYWIEMLFN